MVLVHSFIMWRCQVSAEKKTFGSTQPVAGHFRKKKKSTGTGKLRDSIVYTQD